MQSGSNQPVTLNLKYTLEASGCLLIGLCCFLMSITGLYETAALPLQIVLSLTSFVNPITGIFYISAAQVIPDPPGVPLSSSQLAIAGFFIWHILKYDTSHTQAAIPFFKATTPFFVWTTLCSVLPRGWGFSSILVMVYCLLTGYAVIVLCRRSGNRVLGCALSFLSGQAVAASLFWIIRLNLGTPVEAFDWELYGSSLVEGSRMGTSRGNANTLGVPMGLALAGVLIIFLSALFRSGWGRLASLAAGGVLFLLCFPALIASGTRGAMIAIACGVIFALFNGKILTRSPALCAAVCLVVITGGIYSWTRFELGENWKEVGKRAEYYERALGDRHFGGREMVWQEAVGAIFDSPIIGGGKAKIVSYAGAESLWASHSTFLDAGLMGGIPGFLMYIWFAAYPIYVSWKARSNVQLWLLITAYVVAILTLVSLSGMQYKYLWVLWALFSVWIPKLEFVGSMRPGFRRRRRKVASAETTAVAGGSVQAFEVQ